MGLKDRGAQKAYMQSWRANASPEMLRRQRIRVQERVKELVTWLQNLKKSSKCSRCPESRWFCLDYHHKKPKEKRFEVNSNTIRQRGLSKERLLAEISKCELLCSNCHRAEHFKTR